MSDFRDRFLNSVDALEKQLDRGFFLSFINKIVVDEKKIFTIINELRSLASERFPSSGENTQRGVASAADVEPPMEFQGDESFWAAVCALDAEMRRLETLCRQAEDMRAGAGEDDGRALADLQDRLGRAIAHLDHGRTRMLERLQSPGGEHHGAPQV